MTNKKISLNIFTTLRDIVQGYKQHWSNLAQLAKLETKLAVKTLIKISIVIYFIGFLLTTTWVILLAILFFYLVALPMSFIAAASIILLINLVLIIALIIYIFRIKENLTFQAMRRQLTYQKEINS